ncbi:glycosyltransferase [Ciceribacter azotifigens]|uniref:glycosyltransferase n=1 Tax=Ciceribacter azotifigens TaxID=2069303 RepID=UPI003A843A78
MSELAFYLTEASWMALLFGALIFDIPRYSFSLISLSLLAIMRRAKVPPLQGNRRSVSVILPTFNGGRELDHALASFRHQSLQPLEIIVVDDGSTDDTRAVAQRARSEGIVDLVICHGTRCGRSAAVNAGARFARGDLLFTADADTIFAPTTIERLAAAFDGPDVAAASCNIGVKNEDETVTTGLQGIEYLMSISAGRSFLDTIDAIACCSGACSMYRRDVFVKTGGLDVGPGEDLEVTLRLRRLGHGVRFVPEAWAATSVPSSLVNLLRQRARWDRDALRIRLFMYGQFRLRQPSERLAETLQRLDFIVLDLLPTLTFPFYLVYLVLVLGDAAIYLLAAVYVFMSVLSLFNILLAHVLFSTSTSLFSLLLAPIFPFFQGFIMKLARFATYTAEILFSSSSHDEYVPPRVRRALLGHL